MAARKKDNQINLLPQDKFAATTVGRILAWLLSTFRIMVIAVEMIVMIAFLSRFWLDAKNSDLNEKIEQKKALLAASNEFEKEFKQIQNRIKIFAALSQEERPVSSTLTAIASYLPPDVFLTSFSISAKEISLSGLSPSELSIAQTIANLEKIEMVENVALSEIDLENDFEGLIGFTLSISKK